MATLIFSTLFPTFLWTREFRVVRPLPSSWPSPFSFSFVSRLSAFSSLVVVENSFCAAFPFHCTLAGSILAYIPRKIPVSFDTHVSVGRPRSHLSKIKSSSSSSSSSSSVSRTSSSTQPPARYFGAGLAFLPPGGTLRLAPLFLPVLVASSSSFLSSSPSVPSIDLDGRVGNNLIRHHPVWREARLLFLLRLRPAESGTKSFRTNRSVSTTIYFRPSHPLTTNIALYGQAAGLHLVHHCNAY